MDLTAVAAEDLPQDLRALWDESHSADLRAQNLLNGLNEAQVNWQPKGGAGWSIAQCLDHLAKTNNIYTAAMFAAVRALGRRLPPRQNNLQPGWFERYFIRSMYAPARRKFRSPRQITPASSKSRDQILADFAAAHEQVRSFIGEYSSIDLNRIRFRNPFVSFIRFTLGAGLLVMAAHDRRHLWQAGQVRSAMRLETS